MEQYEGKNIDPARWVYFPRARANGLGLVKAANAGLPALAAAWSGARIGVYRNHGGLAARRVGAAARR